MLPTPNIAPIIYFFTNSLAVLASAAVMFFGLGVMWGWLTWARYRRRARAFQEETDLLRHEIARLKLQIAEQQVPQMLAAPIAPSEESDVELEPTLPGAVVPSSVPEVAEAAKLVPAPNAGPKKESLAAAILAASPVTFAPVAMPDEVMTDVAVEPVAPPAAAVIVPAAPEVRVEEPVPTEPPVQAPPVPPVEGVAAPIEVAAVPVVELPAPASIAPPALVMEPVTSVPMATEPVVIEPTPAQEPALPFVPPPVSEASSLLLPLDMPAQAVPGGQPTHAASEAFASELAEQHVRYDANLGFHYEARPDRWDDLTLLRGVAGTLQERLHECGIFTFKQMAYWTEAQAKFVDQRISAKERVARDRWVQQARDLHYLKYGEKLP